MNHRPVCVKCKTEFEPYNNDTVVVDMHGGIAQEIWMADTWRCPTCGAEIVVGFGFDAVHSRPIDNIDTGIKTFQSSGYLVHYNYPKDEY